MAKPVSSSLEAVARTGRRPAWLYLMGPLLGGLLATAVWRFGFANR